MNEYYNIKVKFYCNGGDTEETVELTIYTGKGNGTEDSQIEKAFHTWLDQNEDCGWEIC